MTNTTELSNQSRVSISELVPDKDKAKLVISLDSQILSKIQTCGQQAAYAHINSIEPVDYTAEALEVGLLMHEMLAEYYRYKHAEPTNIVTAKALSRGEAFAATRPGITHPMMNECADAFGQYVRKYINETWEVIRDTNGNPLVEQTFTKTLFEDEDIKILYIGITDLIVKASSDQQIMLPVDHKTFGSYYKAAILSNQFSGYIWATNAKNLIVNRVGVRSKLGNFERVVVSRTPAQTEEWKRNAIRSVLAHLDDMFTGDFRRNYEACTMYGGCRFARLCGADPSHRKYLIESEYKYVEPWDPITARE